MGKDPAASRIPYVNITQLNPQGFIENYEPVIVLGTGDRRTILTYLRSRVLKTFKLKSLKKVLKLCLI